MSEWKNERPAWCPHRECGFVMQTQGMACVGRLPTPEDHDGTPNDSRFCMQGVIDGVMDLQINRTDVWNINRLLSALYP